MPAWRLKRLNSRHGLPAAHVHGWLSAEHRRWRLQAAKMAKSGLEPGDDPHSFAPAVPGSHRAGPCDPGGAPHGRREHGRLRRPRGRHPGGGKGLSAKCVHQVKYGLWEKNAPTI